MATMLRICIIQHSPVETPGLIAEALHAAGFQSEKFPNNLPAGLAGYDGLVVMGGPQSVCKQDQFPFLRDELRLIESALQAGIPILGICLGSQLLAAALGARVYPGQQKEIGWHPVTLTAEAGPDALLHGLPATFTPLHWHGDLFDLPAGAVALASSALTPVQTYRYGTNAYGFLCHLEVTSRHVADWVCAFADELQSAGVDGAAIMGDAPRYLRALQPLGATIFRRWAELVA